MDEDVAHPTPGHPDSPAARRRSRACVRAIVVLSLSMPGRVFAEAGEAFVVNEPPALPLPAVVADDNPVVGILHVPRDPPHMEFSRGTVWRGELAKRPARHAGKPAQKEGWLTPPAPPVPVETRASAPSGALIQKAEAAEPGRAQASPDAAWRRAIGSPYAAWIALVLLIGVPLLGLVRRHVAGRREDLTRYD